MDAIINIMLNILALVSVPDQAQKTAFIIVFIIGIFIFILGILGKNVEIKLKVFSTDVALPVIDSLTERAVVVLIAAIFLSIGGTGVWATLIRPPIVLNVWTGLTEHEFSFFKKEIVPEFQRQHSERTFAVRVQNVAWEDALIRLKGGEVPDLITFDINGDRRGLSFFLEDLSKDKGLVPTGVHPTLAKYGYSLLTPSGERKTSRGLYFVPFRPNVRLAFWNRKQFEQLVTRCLRVFDGDTDACGSLTHRPATWQDVLTTAEISYKIDFEERVALRASHDVAPQLLLELIEASGGNVCDLGNAHTVRAVTYLRKLWPFINTPEQGKSRRYDWRMASGFLGFESVFLGRAWAVSLAALHESGKEGDFEIYGGWKWDREAKPYYFLGGEVLAVPRRSRHKELAKDFIRFLVSKPVQLKIVNELSWPAMRLDALPTEPWQRTYLDEINQVLLHAHPVPDDWWPHMHDIYARLIAALVDPGTASGDVPLILESYDREMQRRLRPCRPPERLTSETRG